jgi:hypothetical protein
VPQHCSRRASLSSLLVFTLLRDVVLLAAWFPLSAEHLQMLATASAVLAVGLTVFDWLGARKICGQCAVTVGQTPLLYDGTGPLRIKGATPHAVLRTDEHDG